MPRRSSIGKTDTDEEDVAGALYKGVFQRRANLREDDDTSSSASDAEWDMPDTKKTQQAQQDNQPKQTETTTMSGQNTPRGKGKATGTASLEDIQVSVGGEEMLPPPPPPPAPFISSTSRPSSPRGERTASSGSSAGTVTPISPRGGNANTKWSILNRETAERFNTIARKITTGAASIDKSENFEKTWGREWNTRALRKSIYNTVVDFNKQNESIQTLHSFNFSETPENVAAAMDKKTSLYKARHNARHALEEFLKSAAEIQTHHAEKTDKTYNKVLDVKKLAGNNPDIADRTELTTQTKLFDPMLVIQHNMQCFANLAGSVGDALPLATGLTRQFHDALAIIDEKVKRYSTAAAIPGSMPNLNESLLNLYTTLDLKRVFETERGHLTRMSEQTVLQLKNDITALKAKLKLLEKDKSMEKTERKQQKEACETAITYLDQKIEHTKKLQDYTGTYLNTTISSINAIAKTLSDRLVDVVITNPEKQTGGKGPNSDDLKRVIPELIGAYEGRTIAPFSNDTAVKQFEVYLTKNCTSGLTNVMAVTLDRSKKV